MSTALRDLAWPDDWACLKPQTTKGDSSHVRCLLRAWLALEMFEVNVTTTIVAVAQHSTSFPLSTALQLLSSPCPPHSSMLEATVLGSGTSAASLLFARRNAHANSSHDSLDSPAHPSPPSAFGTFLAQPRSLKPPNPKPIGGTSNYDGSCYADEQLTWSGMEVAWTRGVEVMRRFSYDYLNQEVACAAFAWFKTPEEQWMGENPASSSDVSQRNDKARLLSKGPPPADGTFGPFHDSQNAKWMLRPKKPRRKQVGLQRVVVVVLQNKMVIHFATGEKHFRRLSFPVDSVWPLPTGGVLLQRRLDAPSHWRTPRRSSVSQLPRSSLEEGIGDTSIDSLSLKLEQNKDKDKESPRLFSVTDMFDDPLAVGESIIDGGIGEDDLPPRIIPSAGGPVPVKPSVTVLLVTPDPYPFVVGWDEREGKVVVFRYATINGEDEEDKLDRPSSTAAQLRPHELMKQANAPGRRARPFAAARGQDRRGSAVTDIFDRSRRRGSRLSSAADELPISHIPSTDLAPGARGTRLSTGGGHEAKMRRVSTVASIMREDMHPFNNDRVLDMVAEDLHDTTMVHGIEGGRQLQNRRSDIMLDRIWGWRPPSR